MPQITDIFLDQEEDMLDCQQIITFGNKNQSKKAENTHNTNKDSLVEY